jgi:peptidoglycan/xylan/chitin deacetylase (PgdA/CDA1 family)
MQRAFLILGLLASIGVGAFAFSSSSDATRVELPREANASKTHHTTPSELSVPLLVYHHIRATKPYPKSTWSYKMSVSPSIFEAQMKWLQGRGYTTITLDQLVQMREGSALALAKPVVITFDDNHRSQYEIAFPILRQNGQLAVFYLITNRLQNTSFITEDEVLEMVASGMDIQSHSDSHSMLTNLSASRLATELSDSRRVLEELTGKPVQHIAYPLTAHNQRVRDAAKAAGYVTGTIMDPRKSRMKDNLLRLPRIMMTDDTNLEKVLP